MRNLLIFMFTLICLSTSHAELETIKGAQKDFESFKKEMSLKLEDVESQITQLQENAKIKGDEVHQKYAKELADKRLKLKSEIDSLNNETKTNWTKMKKNLSESIDNLHAKAKKALQN